MTRPQSHLLLAWELFAWCANNSLAPAWREADSSFSGKLLSSVYKSSFVIKSRHREPPVALWLLPAMEWNRGEDVWTVTITGHQAQPILRPQSEESVRKRGRSSVGYKAWGLLAFSFPGWCGTYTVTLLFRKDWGARLLPWESVGTSPLSPLPGPSPSPSHLGIWTRLSGQASWCRWHAIVLDCHTCVRKGVCLVT